MATYNNNCEGCGCGPSVPEPCITPPPVCPTPQLCIEITDANCVKYTGPALICNDIPVIPTNTSVADALAALVDLTCEDACCTIPVVTSVEDTDYVMLCVDDTEFCNYDGLLYNWHVLKTIVNNDPIDNPINTWRVPNNNDWQALVVALNPSATFTPWNNTAAGPLKSLTCWSIPNSAATNLTTMSVLPSVYRLDTGDFTDNNGQIGAYWGSDGVGTDTAYMYSLEFDDDTVFRTIVDHNFGLRVRLVRPAECNEDPGDAIPNAYKDNEGTTYNGVVIGTLVWLTEDLRDKKNNFGVTIPNVTNNNDWSNLLGLEGLCYPMNNQDYQIEYSIGCQQVKISYDDFGGGGAKKSCTTDVTYQELYDKIVTETLEPCMIYRITDYRSTNFLNGSNFASQSFGRRKPAEGKSFLVDGETPDDPFLIHTGETEVLRVTALTTQTLALNAISEKYPEDIIHYEAFTNKLGIPFIVELYDGAPLPDGGSIATFGLQWDGTNVYAEVPTDYPILYGHMLYVYAYFEPGGGSSYDQDGVYEPVVPGITESTFAYTNDKPYDGYPKRLSNIKLVNNNTKVLFLDLDFNDYQAYIPETLYFQYDYPFADSYGYIIRRYDPVRQIDMPFDFRGRVYRRFSTPLFEVYGVPTGLGAPYYGIPGGGYEYDDLDYFDGTVFGSVPGDNTVDLYNIVWKSLGGPQGWWRGYNDNVMFNAPCGYFTETCQPANEVHDIRINGQLDDSSFGGRTNTSVINVSYGTQNIFDTMISCQINTNTMYTNLFSNSFQNNIFNCEALNYNVISRVCQHNNVNVTYFGGNQLQQGFQKNNISTGYMFAGNGPAITDINLPIYREFNTDIILARTGAYSTAMRVTYIDDALGLVVKPITTL